MLVILKYPKWINGLTKEIHNIITKQIRSSNKLIFFIEKIRYKATRIYKYQYGSIGLAQIIKISVISTPLFTNLPQSTLNKPKGILKMKYIVTKFKTCR